MEPSDYQRILDVKRQTEDALLKLPGVHGVSIGYKVVGDRRTDELAIVVHVSHKVPEEQLAPDERIPATIQGVSTDVIAHPQPSASVDSARYRPLKGGCQIWLKNNDYGTLGAIVRRRSDGASCLLTNQHILPVDGTVYQPDDRPGYEIADVASHVLSPKVDGAIAKIRAGVSWTNWVLGVGAIQGTHTVGITDIGGAGYPVQKCGRTTGWTNGLVTQLDFRGRRTDGWEFQGQICISNDGGTFQGPGDSGSVVVDAQRRIVGLLWGGNESFGVASPIGDVENELEVEVIKTSMPLLRLIHEGKGDSGWLQWTTFDGTTWSPNVHIPGEVNAYGTSGPPSVFVYREKLYCMREGRGDSGWVWYASHDGTSWSQDALLPNPSNAYGTTGSPALAVFRGKLYCARQGRDDKGWVWCATFDGTSWSADGLISTSGGTLGTSGPPALVVYQNKLYCIREGRDDRGWLWCTSTADGVTWTTDMLLPNKDDAYGTSGPAALATYRGVLYCARQGRGDSGWVWCATFDGTTWSTDQLIPNGKDAYGVSGSPALVVYNDRLYCIREGRNNSGQLWIASFDGTTWSTDHRLPNDASPYGTSGRPALGVFP